MNIRLPANPKSQSPLKRFEEDHPQTRAALLSLWLPLAPLVRQADPQRYRSVQEALEQDLPFQVLVSYIHRECVRALEK